MKLATQNYKATFENSGPYFVFVRRHHLEAPSKTGSRLCQAPYIHTQKGDRSCPDETTIQIDIKHFGENTHLGYLDEIMQILSMCIFKASHQALKTSPI